MEAEASGEGGSLMTKGRHVEVEECLWDIQGQVCKRQGKCISELLIAYFPAHARARTRTVALHTHSERNRHESRTLSCSLSHPQCLTYCLI